TSRLVDGLMPGQPEHASTFAADGHVLPIGYEQEVDDDRPSRTSYVPSGITLLEYITSNPYSVLLLPISAIFCLSDVARVVVGGGGVPLISIGVVGAISVFFGVCRKFGLRSVRLKDPGTSTTFYPFLGCLNKSDRRRFIVPRPDDLK